MVIYILEFCHFGKIQSPVKIIGKHYFQATSTANFSNISDSKVTVD